MNDSFLFLIISVLIGLLALIISFLQWFGIPPKKISGFLTKKARFFYLPFTIFIAGVVRQIVTVKQAGIFAVVGISILLILICISEFSSAFEKSGRPKPKLSKVDKITSKFGFYFVSIVFLFSCVYK